jgi:hypothetical protein
MKTRWIQLIAVFAMVVLCISTCATTSNAAGNWNEDFEGEMGDWTIFAYENRTTLVTTEGSFSVVDGRLTATGDDINRARHDSDLTVGSWCFDMFVPDTHNGCFYVDFMINDTRPFPEYPSTSVTIGASMLQNRFWIWQTNGYSWTILKTIYTDSIQGLYHIKVNRTDYGKFGVYLNDTREASFTNPTVNSSTYFVVDSWNATGAWVDNIYVSDDLNFESPTLTPTPTNGGNGGIDWILIAVGGGVAVAVIVLAIVLLRRR